MPAILSRFSEEALSTVPRELHLSTLDTELESLEMTIRRARKMRNMKTGVCKLPREILVYIFESLQCIWPPKREEDEPDAEDDVPIGSTNVVVVGPKFRSGWMCVTHVCSVWREVRALLVHASIRTSQHWL